MASRLTAPRNDFAERRKPGDPSAAMLRPARLLAQVIQDEVTPEEVCEWLVAVVQGRDPNAPRATDDEGSPRMPTDPPSWADRRDAMRMLLSYGWGLPVQSVQVQALIAHAAVPVESGEPADLARLTDGELAAYERVLARMAGEAVADDDGDPEVDLRVLERVRAPEAPAVIDVEVDEVPIPAPPVPSDVVEHRFVGSSNIVLARWRAAASTVDVEFADGATWRYRDFGPGRWAEWLAAPSAGAWFHREVRAQPHLHPGEQVTGPPLPERAGGRRDRSRRGSSGPGVL